VIEIDRATYVKEVVGARALHDLWISSRISKIRPALAVARCPIMTSWPSIMNGAWSIKRYRLKARIWDRPGLVQNHPSTTKQYQGGSQLGQVLDPGRQIARMFASLM